MDTMHESTTPHNNTLGSEAATPFSPSLEDRRSTFTDSTPVGVLFEPRGRIRVLRSAPPPAPKNQTKDPRPNFTQIPNAFLDDPNLSAQEKLLIALLMSHDFGQHKISPGLTSLAHRVALGERQVRTIINGLKWKGLITVRQRGQQQTNQYTVHLQTRYPTVAASWKAPPD